jgi:hypothetical protein
MLLLYAEAFQLEFWKGEFFFLVVVGFFCVRERFWGLFGCCSGCGSHFSNMVVGTKPIGCRTVNHWL